MFEALAKYKEGPASGHSIKRRLYECLEASSIRRLAYIRRIYRAGQCGKREANPRASWNNREEAEEEEEEEEIDACIHIRSAVPR
jgi:hypothetical protein